MYSAAPACSLRGKGRRTAVDIDRKIADEYGEKYWKFREISPMSDDYSSATLLLIRHGQARAHDGSYGPDTPLSELGRTQAEKLAHALSNDNPPTVAYTSPFLRALETAKPLCKLLSLEPVVDARLVEFELGTVSLYEAQQRPDLVFWQPDHSGVEGGETLEIFSLRVAAFCAEVAERHQGDRVAIFAHAGTIDAAIRWSVGLPPTSPWQHEFDLTNASITEIVVWPRGRVPGGAPRYSFLRRIADVSHLGELLSGL